MFVFCKCLEEKQVYKGTYVQITELRKMKLLKGLLIQRHKCIQDIEMRTSKFC